MGFIKKACSRAPVTGSPGASSHQKTSAAFERSRADEVGARMGSDHGESGPGAFVDVADQGYPMVATLLVSLH